MKIPAFLYDDLYKFTTQYAYLNNRTTRKALARYKYIMRNKSFKFPSGFAVELRRIVKEFEGIQMTKDEYEYMRLNCKYLDVAYLDYLRGYRFDSSEVIIQQVDGDLDITIEGYLYKTVLWEVRLLAIISALINEMLGRKFYEVESRAQVKALELSYMNANYSDFGNRREANEDVHRAVLSTLKKYSGEYLTGTSNVRLAMEHNIPAHGTHPHELFMFWGAVVGFAHGNTAALEHWVDVYQGDLGTALTDTYTTDNFLLAFTLKYAKLFDGIRHDSNSPLIWTDKFVNHYNSLKISTANKRFIYSDNLNVSKVREIKNHINTNSYQFIDSYGIGTNLTNDCAPEGETYALNQVIKLMSVKPENMGWRDTVKLSDDEMKYTGDNPAAIEACKYEVIIKK